MTAIPQTILLVADEPRPAEQIILQDHDIPIVFLSFTISRK